MNTIEKLMTKNYCYTNPTKMDPGGLMLHSVGTPQPKAMVFINQWDNSKRDKNNKLITQVSIHGFIDALTGDYYHTMPYNYQCWHAGSGPNGSANKNYIGVEMCEPDCIKYKPNSATFTVSDKDKPRAQEMVRRTYESAVQVFADLCKQFHFDPLSPNVILSHKEGNINGIASPHGDPEHLWAGLDLPFTMDGFRHDVAACMQGGFLMPNDGTEKKEEVKTEVKPVTPTIEPYTVRVTTPVLRIRETPSTSGKAMGFTGAGVFTIVDEADGPGATKWGLLKSHAAKRDGWISLDIAKKINS